MLVANHLISELGKYVLRLCGQKFGDFLQGRLADELICVCAVMFYRNAYNSKFLMTEYIRRRKRKSDNIIEAQCVSDMSPCIVTNLTSFRRNLLSPSSGTFYNHALLVYYSKE